MNLIDEGMKRKLTRLEDDNKYIIYLHESKRRNYGNVDFLQKGMSFLTQWQQTNSLHEDFGIR